MHSEQITTIEDVFSLDDRGLVGTGTWLNEAQRLAPGALVEVMRPDGTSFRTSLRGAEPFTKCFGERRPIGLLFGELKEKEDLPVGSRVWLINES